MKPENSAHIEKLSAFGAEINGNTIVLYRGANVSKALISKLRYGDSLSAVEGATDATGNDGAKCYGKNVVRFELSVDDVVVTGAGEYQYKEKSESLQDGTKYPSAIYRAYNDYFGSNFTAKEVDKQEDVRQMASCALNGGKEEFDTLLVKHNAQSLSEMDSAITRKPYQRLVDKLKAMQPIFEAAKASNECLVSEDQHAIDRPRAG